MEDVGEISDFGFRNADLPVDFGMRISECGMRISDCGIRIRDKFPIADFGFRIAELPIHFGLRIANFGFDKPLATGIEDHGSENLCELPIYRIT